MCCFGMRLELIDQVDFECVEIISVMAVNSIECSKASSQHDMHEGKVSHWFLNGIVASLALILV